MTPSRVFSFLPGPGFFPPGLFEDRYTFSFVFAVRPSQVMRRFCLKVTTLETGWSPWVLTAGPLPKKNNTDWGVLFTSGTFSFDQGALPVGSFHG